MAVAVTVPELQAMPCIHLRVGFFIVGDVTTFSSIGSDSTTRNLNSYQATARDAVWHTN